MIDLRNKSLPNAIKVDGKDFLIKTDFRLWIEFGNLAKEQRPLSDYLFLFENEIPLGNFFPQLMDFYFNPNTTPNYSGSTGNEKIVDYIEDGEYIIASFMQTYGINLLEVDMHWHLFNALFIGLPDDSKIKQIMSMRAWSPSKKNYEQQCRTNKEAWSFPTMTREEEQEIMKEINELFYNS